MQRVRVLVVDDSATMRSIIASRLSEDPQIEVIGGAANPHEARAAIKALNPDVITLDIEMPGMNGLEFLDKIMRLRPMPVIMVSTLTQRGAAATIEALAMGAVDCVGKPLPGASSAPFADLAATVKAAAMAPPGAFGNHAIPDRPMGGFRTNGRIVAIGASTGGVEALSHVLAGFPRDCPPTIIVQHMPQLFTKSFAARLNQNAAPEIAEAADGAPLEPGLVYIAPGGTAHLEISGGPQPVCRLRPGETVSGHRPSVDVMMRSVAAIGKRVVGVLLTGMGRDGAQGLLEIRRAGGRTIGQDEASSVVYGMPRVAFEIGAVERQLPLGRIGSAVLDLCSADRDRRV